MGNVIPLSQKVQYSAERRLGAQEQRYETDFFLQRQSMHVAVPQCMLGMSVVLVHDSCQCIGIYEVQTGNNV